MTEPPRDQHIYTNENPKCHAEPRSGAPPRVLREMAKVLRQWEGHIPVENGFAQAMESAADQIDALTLALSDAAGCERDKCPCTFGDRHLWHEAYREKKAALEQIIDKAIRIVKSHQLGREDEDSLRELAALRQEPQR